MKKILLFSLISITSFSQITITNKSYKTNCGKVINIGDTLKLGIGTGYKRNFAFVYHRSASSKINNLLYDERFGSELGKDYTMRKIVVNDFVLIKERTYIVFEKRKTGSKIIDIEPAIETKELIFDCNK